MIAEWQHAGRESTPQRQTCGGRRRAAFQRGDLSPIVGIDNLICLIAEPTLESAEAGCSRIAVSTCICVTGGPAVAQSRAEQWQTGDRGRWTGKSTGCRRRDGRPRSGGPARSFRAVRMTTTCSVSPRRKSSVVESAFASADGCDGVVLAPCELNGRRDRAPSRQWRSRAWAKASDRHDVAVKGVHWSRRRGAGEGMAAVRTSRRRPS